MESLNKREWYANKCKYMTHLWKRFPSQVMMQVLFTVGTSCEHGNETSDSVHSGNILWTW